VAKATDKTKVLKSFQRIIAPPYCPGWKLLGHIFASFGKLLQMNDSPETNKNPLENRLKKQVIDQRTTTSSSWSKIGRLETGGIKSDEAI
jgi:hypothetical protein